MDFNCSVFLRSVTSSFHSMSPIISPVCAHAGVKQMIGLHFVATGRMSRELGRCFSLLFERRHSSDYDDFAYSSEEEIDELLPKATDFIEAIEVLLKE